MGSTSDLSRSHRGSLWSLTAGLIKTLCEPKAADLPSLHGVPERTQGGLVVATVRPSLLRPEALIRDTTRTNMRQMQDTQDTCAFNFGRPPASNASKHEGFKA